MSGARPTARVVYESMFGNTEAIATAVAEGLRSRGWDAAVAEVGSAPAAAQDVDLLVLGAPTHAFSLSRPATRAEAVSKGAAPARVETGLREWLALLPPATASSPPIAIFDTRVSKVRRLPAAASRKAARLVRDRRYQVVDRPSAFLVDDVAGPLLAGETDRAAEWGRSLADQLSA